MVIGLLTVELHLASARSLKDKRMVLRGIKDRLKKFNVAVSETEYHDLWQRAELGIVTISTTDAAVDRALAAARDEIERVEPGLITRTQVDMMEA
jgi:uncharacterized protein YlxP (DUF503 family)